MPKLRFRIWRGKAETGSFQEYDAEVGEGMVVLDAIHQIQAEQCPDLAVRWNCKAGKCGSCSAEINGVPSLMCMTRCGDLPPGETVVVEPMKAFPLVRDLVTDVSWNYRAKQQIKPFKPRDPDAADGTWRIAQEDVERVQEFRKCIECFLCQDVCHVLREHQKHDAPVRLLRRARDAPTGRRRPRLRPEEARRDRLLQHHEVLHEGLPRAHHDHRQRHHPAQGARRGRVLRPGRQALPGSGKEGLTHGTQTDLAGIDPEGP
jgi:succinate dehydrogenase/fumarate reductase iron-sulfur protein